MEKLRTFYYVVKLKSLTKAAEQLALTQPAVSFQIRSLEEECGTKLLTRSGRKMVPTEAGKVVFSYAEKILALIEELHLTLANCRDPLVGKVYLGASILVSTYLLPPILGQFRKLYPGIHFELKVRYASELLQFVYEGELSFAIMGEGSRINNKTFEIETLLQDKLVLVVPSDRRLSGETTLEDVLKENFILPEPVSALRKYIDRKLEELGVHIEPYIEIGNIEVVKKLVEQGFGCSILPYISVQEEVRNGKLRICKIKDLDLTRNILLVKKQNKVLAASEELFIKFLKQQIATLDLD